jgi:predicted secreted protein
MSPFSLLVVYILVWWLTLFSVLPWGIRSQHEDDEVVRGSEPGAPSKDVMKRKALITTIVATILWAIICSIIHFGLIDFRDMPFMPDMPDT